MKTSLQFYSCCNCDSYDKGKKNTILSTHFTPRALYFAFVPCFDFIRFKWFTVMFWGIPITIKKFSFFMGGKVKSHPMGSGFCTRVCIYNKSARECINFFRQFISSKYSTEDLFCKSVASKSPFKECP